MTSVLLDVRELTPVFAWIMEERNRLSHWWTHREPFHQADAGLNQTQQRHQAGPTNVQNTRPSEAKPHTCALSVHFTCKENHYTTTDTAVQFQTLNFSIQTEPRSAVDSTSEDRSQYHGRSSPGPFNSFTITKNGYFDSNGDGADR